MIRGFFPNRTHRQIKRKCKYILNRVKGKFEKEDFLRRKERRKSFFDEEIMEEKCEQPSKSTKLSESPKEVDFDK